ncbi:MAG: DUF1552 domain-containing protein [Planctomycetota bacterium]
MQPIASRRTFLRGAGAAAIAVPLLEALAPTACTMQASAMQASAIEASGAAAPKRFVAINGGLGFHGPHLFPSTPGKLSPSTPYLKQVGDHLDRMTLFSGLSHPEQQGNNGHASEMTFLTSAQRPGLAGFRNTISLDQLIAARIGPQTRFPYMALSARGGSSMSWTASGVNIPGESSPAKLFAAMFLDGNRQKMDAELAALRRGRSILDTVGGRAEELGGRISGRDRHKLAEYLTSIRELEMRLQQNEAWVQRPKPKVDIDPPSDIRDKNQAIERQRLMYDIIALALQNDSTRTITFELGGLNSVPAVQGVSSDWHGLSHHGRDPEKIEELKLIEQAEFAAFSEFLGKLRSVDEAGTDLLENTAILFASNLGNASAHNWHNLPIIVAGGKYRHGNYVAHDAENNTPLANLFVELARRMDVDINAFGSSTAESVRGLETV